MSPSVEEIRKAAEARMRELGPVIQEIEQLQKILEVTGGEDADATAGGDRGGGHGGRPSRSGSRSSPRRGPDGRAVRGSNKTLIMEVVRDHPGIAAPELATITGLKREVISATLYRLKKQRNVEPYGRGVRVATAPPKERRFILELAEGNPGVTTAELAEVTGLDPVVTEVTVEAMKRDGELVELEGGVSPAGRPRG